jgi:hypothetical protein
MRKRGLGSLDRKQGKRPWKQIAAHDTWLCDQTVHTITMGWSTVSLLPKPNDFQSLPPFLDRNEMMRYTGETGGLWWFG